MAKWIDFIRKPNGRFQLYFAGKRILSYGRKGALKSSTNYFIHTKYGKIYYPYYNTNILFSSNPPEVYNAQGRAMKTFFIRDAHTSAYPYSNSKYFLWDRYNIGLETHFYTHRSMLETMGKPTYRYGMFIEPPSITPQDYKIFDKYKGLEKDFDSIFTFDKRLLDRLENAKFFPASSMVWYEKEKFNSNAYKLKTKNISILCSNKKFSKLHKLRMECAFRCKRLKLVDTFGQFDGGPRVTKSDTLTPYRYAIAIENTQEAYYFTEKILDCFAAQTIPIYLGATEIDKFFNPDGIIKIGVEDIDHIEDILKQCTPSEYERRIPAILDNYKRVKAYLNINDWLYEKYFLKKEK